MTLQEAIKSLTEYMICEGMNITPFPKVILKHNDVENANNFFGKTAYYDPTNHIIVIFTKDRHPIDIAKSYMHEMYHHMQNLEGRLTNITTDNTSQDDYLNEIEKETYMNSQILYRNWKDKTKYRNG